MRNLHALFRPRHIVASLLVLLAFSGTSIGLIGFAAAADHSDAGAFTFAEPKVGDHMVYAVEDISGESRPWAYTGGPDTVGLTWLPDERILVPDAGLAWHNSLRVVEDWADDDYDRDLTYHIIPGTAAASGYSYGRDEVKQNDDGTTLRVTASHITYQERLEDAVPCGVRSVLQGRTLPLTDDGVLETFTCRASGVRIGEGDTLRIVANGTMDGVQGVIVEASNDRPGESMRYWYQEGIPYAVRIEEHDGGLQRVWTMTAFERGETEMRDAPETEALTVPPLVMTARPAWGIDAAGVDHTFPPKEAWTHALQDPQYTNLRDFLDSHEDAYVADLYYQNLRSEGTDGDWDSWSFRVTDGVEELDVHIRRIQDKNSGLLPDLVPDTPSYDYSDRGVEEARSGTPMPDQVPAEAPTWASMLAQWDVYKSDAYDVAGNSVRVSYFCYDPCDEVTSSYSAGFTEYDREYTQQAIGGDTIDDLRFSTLEWTDIPGRDDYSLDRPEGYHEQTQAWRPEGQPPAAAKAVEPTMSTQAAVITPIWQMPSTQAVAVAGSAGLLFAAVYWLSPLVRGAGMGLFSRVSSDAMLEHPARKRLADLIEAQPGIHHSAIVREIGGGKGAVDHHLRKLQEGGFITSGNEGGYRCYFPKRGTDRRLQTAVPVLKSAAAKAVVAHLKDVPSARAADLRRTIGVSPSTLHYHMGRLQAAGVIDVRKEGNGQTLTLTSVGRMVAAS